MRKFTAGPVFVPSSTPTYMARYEPKHLAEAAQQERSQSSGARQLLQAVGKAELRGYAVLLAEYLKESWPKYAEVRFLLIFKDQKPRI